MLEMPRVPETAVATFCVLQKILLDLLEKSNRNMTSHNRIRTYYYRQNR